ncbi:SfiI-subtelomeric fragment related protein family member, putative [Theileria annulata]|uniref:SfiI-subtelomeric related protein family member, putative n=1 Tax=Theileria annulata TaxID=5874 RepID=Q4UFW9_THEAN|nr:SfiI-subtelomeric fragment related protein family member, putative [Theileria annulata]CAI74020.1 SfiI-subtelomeric fragment related protein family member, putative [Theileria annulata]
MKICIISLSLLYYITFINQWNFVESHPTSSSNDSTTTETAPETNPTPISPESTKSTNVLSSSYHAGTSIIPSESSISTEIKNTQSTNEFDYSRDDDFHKYTPKSGHVFSKVSMGTDVLWESKDDLYGIEVMFIEGVRYLAILLNDNTFILFLQLAGQWKDITDTKCDVSKLRFFGENDTELKSSDYKVFIFRFFFTFTFNTGVKCQKIKHGNEFVWKHDDDPNYKSIKSFSLGLGSNKFFIKNQSDQTKELDTIQSTSPTKTQVQSPTPETTPVTSGESETQTKPTTTVTPE